MVTVLLQGDPGGEGGKKDLKSRKERLEVLLVHMHNAGFVDQLSVKNPFIPEVSLPFYTPRSSSRGQQS